MRLVGVVAVSGLALAAAGCGKPPASNSSASSSASAGKAAHGCMVTDTGGINDRSFNAAAWKGLQDAKSKNSSITSEYVQSTAESDYTPNLNSFVQKKS
jgi:basic membrane protein A